MPHVVSAPAEAPICSGQPGSYFLGRRSYNPHDKVWGYVWRSDQSPRAARLVILNEQRKLAPDRAVNQFGGADRCLYRLSGHFTGDLVYEPNTNLIYPEFMLTGHVLLEERGRPHSMPSTW